MQAICQKLLVFAAILIAVPACAQHEVSNSNIPSNPYGRAWLCHPYDGKWVCDADKNGRPDVYTPGLSGAAKQSAIARALGWIPDNSDTITPSVCGGHYYQPNYPELTSEQPLGSSVSHVFSKEKKYTLGGNVDLSGNVEIVQPGRRMYADHVVLYPNPKTPSRPERISAEGNVRVRQPGQMILGKSLKANLYTHKAELTDAYYLMSVKSDWSQPDSVGEDENFTGFAHGHADVIQQNSKTNYVFDDASYTTCPPGTDTWRLKASKIILDRISGRGVAENTVLHIQGLPVFYFPYFSFPLTNKRQSGFLYGSLGSSSTNGFTVTAPYYLNIAPNYDDTITPMLFVRRGAMLANQFRYLTPSTNGVLNTTLLPDDRARDRDRWMVNYLQNTQFNANWSGRLDYNDVSDANYLKDFENSNAQSANQTYVNRDADLIYNGRHWDFQGYLKDYKIVDQSLTTANRPYDTLPELNLQSQYPNFLGPLSFSLNSQAVNFQKKSSINSTSPVEAQRLHMDPTLGLALVKSYGYIKPSISVDNTDYEIQQGVVNGFPNSQKVRSIPEAQIDSALFFDRTFNLLGDEYSQTVEPRLYYLYKPYRNQNNIPVFDSSVIQFNYSSLFSDRRFNGLDRVGDANHLAYALSTDIDDNAGRQVLQAALGQIYYFQDRRVSLCRTAGCIASEDPNYQKNTSDVAGLFNAMLSQTLNLHVDFTINPHTRLIDTQNYTLQYIPDPAHVFNLGFSSNRTDYSLLSNQQLLSGTRAPMLAQFTSSFLWKINPVWRVIGNWNYSTNRKRTVDIFAGFEYSPCSWAMRFIWQKYLLNSNVNDPNSLDGSSTSAFAVQFQLKGLGNLGSSKIQYLASQVPGYSPTKSGF